MRNFVGVFIILCQTRTHDGWSQVKGCGEGKELGTNLDFTRHWIEDNQIHFKNWENQNFPVSARGHTSNERREEKRSGHFTVVQGAPLRAMCNPLRPVNLKLSLQLTTFTSTAVAGARRRGGRGVGFSKRCADDTQEILQLLLFHLEDGLVARIYGIPYSLSTVVHEWFILNCAGFYRLRICAS